MSSQQVTVKILSASWERDHESATVRQQHGAYIWSQNSANWGYRGRSNPFPRFSIFDPDSYSNAMWNGHREGFYQMSSTLNNYNNKQAPVKFLVTKANLGNSCFAHPKQLTVDYLCIRNGSLKQHKNVTAKENEEIVLDCSE
jgi:hypothetical protein